MVLFDYSREPRSDIAFVDMKSFMPLANASSSVLTFKNLALCHERVENSLD